MDVEIKGQKLLKEDFTVMHRLALYLQYVDLWEGAPAWTTRSCVLPCVLLFDMHLCTLWEVGRCICSRYWVKNSLVILFREQWYVTLFVSLCIGINCFVIEVLEILITHRKWTAWTATWLVFPYQSTHFEHRMKGAHSALTMLRPLTVLLFEGKRKVGRFFRIELSHCIFIL